MAKAKKKWIDLDFASPDALKAEDIPVDVSNSIKDKTDAADAHIANVTTNPHDVTASQVEIVGDGISIDNVQDVLNKLWSTTSLSGFEITLDPGNSEVTIADGTAMLRAADSIESPLLSLSVTGGTYEVPDGTSQYFYADYNGGSPIVKMTTDFITVVTASDRANLHAVTKTQGLPELGHIDVSQLCVNYMQRANIRGAFVDGTEKVQGATLTINPATWEVALTAGTFNVVVKPIYTPAFNTSIADSFKSVYGSTVNGWIRNYGETVIDYANYNNGTGLSPIGNNKYGVHWLFYEFNDPTRFTIAYGNGNYSLIEAQNELLPIDLPNEIAFGSTGVEIYKIIIEDNGDVTEIIDLRSKDGATGTQAASIHNELGGLNYGDYQHLTVAEKAAFGNPGAVIGVNTKEMTGFDIAQVNATQQDLLDMSFDVGTEVFTLSPKAPFTEYSYFYRGKLATVSIDKTASCPFATSRQWWIYFNDETATLVAVSALTNSYFEIIRDNVFVAELIWNKAGTALIKSSFEGHALQYWGDHLREHLTVRTRYGNGLSVVPVDSSTDLTVSGGEVWDEDIQWNIETILTGSDISVLWREGSGGGVATWDGLDYLAGVKTDGGGKPQYNLNTGGTWSLEEPDNNDWVLVHYFATPDFGDNSIVAVCGQNSYESRNLARSGALIELLTLSTDGLPFPEYKALATAIINPAATSWDFDNFDSPSETIIDWRSTTVGTALSTTVTDHGTLGGLTDDDHTQYLLANGLRALTGNLSAGTNKITDLVDGTTGTQDASTVSQMEAEVMQRMVYKGAYTPTTYDAFDTVIDGQWTMVSTEDNNLDKPAPQPIGDPEWSQEDVLTGFTELSDTTVIHSGGTYTFTKTGWLKSIRVAVPQLTDSTNYRIIMIENPDTADPIVTIIDNPLLSLDDWQVVALGNKIIPSGTIIRFIVDAYNSGTDTKFSGGWEYAGIGDALVPLSGEFVVNTAGTRLRYNKTDLDSVSRSTELLGASDGTDLFITQTNDISRYIEYATVGAAVDGTTYVEYVVTPIDSGKALQTGNATTNQFDTPIDQNTRYWEDADYWLTGEPAYATVEGYLTIGGTPSVVPNNSYGIDIQFQEASFSTKWGVLAYSGAGSSGGSSYVPNLSQVLAIGSDADGSQINNAGDAVSPQDLTTLSQVEAALDLKADKTNISEKSGTVYDIAPGDVLRVFRTDAQIEIKEVSFGVDVGTADINIRYSTNPSAVASGTKVWTSDKTAVVDVAVDWVTVFDNSVIPANSIIAIEVVSTGGGALLLDYTITYDESVSDSKSGNLYGLENGSITRLFRVNKEIELSAISFGTDINTATFNIRYSLDPSALSSGSKLWTVDKVANVESSMVWTTAFDNNTIPANSIVALEIISITDESTNIDFTLYYTG